MSRPARVWIDLSALRHNFTRIKHIAPHAKVMAVIKANAYGHGLERVASLLNQADAFGVSCVEEAMRLHTTGIKQAIVLLEGAHTTEDMRLIQRLGLESVVHAEHQLAMLAQLRKPSTQLDMRIWLKVDSGMHRLGFSIQEIPRAWRRLMALGIRPPGLLTHLAAANQPQHPLNRIQLQRFNALCRTLQAEASIANSAAILSDSATYKDWIRPGLMLYGVSPFPDTQAHEYGLRAVMSFESKLIAIQSLKRGEPVGYGASWQCPQDMSVGVVAAGYGDGYPRHAKPGTPVLVNGVQCALVGRPSMDMLTVDLRPCPRARVGDPVILWGAGLAIEEVARAADTIPYELLCHIQQRRLRLLER